MLSQFFILSARGDTIIIRDFRLDLGRETSEIFFRKVKFWKGDPPPCFTVEGINFFYTKKFGIFFVATTKHNVSPSFVMDILYRMMKVFRDYCGVLNEESIRKNFVLIYELIDEIIDYGHPQLMTTENIKQFIVNEAILIQQKQQQSSNFRPTIFSSNTIPSTAIQRPLSQITDKKSMKNEIFVDIFEKLTVVFNANGFVINSSIDGVIQMKSYLQGNPELRLVLNDDLVVGRANAGAGGGQVVGSVVLDDCNFHECVDVRDFEAMKTLTINPPDGEFLVMNYRINGDYSTPFRIYPFIDELSQYKLQLTLKVRATFPPDHFATQVLIKFPVPRTTTNVSFEIPKGIQGHCCEYKQQEQLTEWGIKKFQGGVEHTIIVKITLKNPTATECRKEIGPISMNFEIPMYNVSNLQVKYLKIASTQKNYNPYRWVRYVTQSSSYVCRT
eukprot:403369694